jgi:hypothetical protein
MTRHDFWIPTYVGMTKRRKNGTYDTKPRKLERGTQGVRLIKREAGRIASGCALAMTKIGGQSLRPTAYF